MSSLPPLGGGSPPRGGPGGLKNLRDGGGERPRAREEEPGMEAMRAQREASRQIESAVHSVEEARRDADYRIDQIHDYYDARSEVEIAKEDAAYERERLKGYERLKELKRAQDAELHRTRREGDREIDKLSNYYRDTSYTLERSGDEKIHQMEQQQARSLEYAQRSKSADVEFADQVYSQQAKEIREEKEARLADLQQSARAEFDERRAATTEATLQSNESFEKKYAARLQEHDRQLGELGARASSDLKSARRDTTDKLAAYSSRQNDPFYRAVDLNVQVKDDGDFYVLTATIPEHEQKGVSVSVKGSQLVLSGVRRSEEKTDISPGRTQSTNAYQSYQETFPVSWPVDANKLTREFDGDQLTVRVPKKNEYAYKPRTESKAQVSRARIERPQFPANLPHVSQNPYEENMEAGSPRDSRGKKPLG